MKVLPYCFHFWILHIAPSFCEEEEEEDEAFFCLHLLISILNSLYNILKFHHRLGFTSAAAAAATAAAVKPFSLPPPPHNFGFHFLFYILKKKSRKKKKNLCEFTIFLILLHTVVTQHTQLLQLLCTSWGLK